MYNAAIESKDKPIASKLTIGALGIPAAIVSPIVVLPEAASKVVEAVRNQLKPDACKEDQMKWKTNN